MSGSYPFPISSNVSTVMRANTRTNTKPEIKYRSALHKSGYRFRKDYLIYLPERNIHIDIAFPSIKLAVFIDGCYWHGCPLHYKVPKHNKSYWRKKILKNKRRDNEVNRILLNNKWKIVRIWEHERLEKCIGKLSSKIDYLRSTQS